MARAYASAAYVVAATKGDKTEYWAAAVPRDETLIAVGATAGPEWTLALTDRLLSPAIIVALRMRPDSVRRLNRFHAAA
jgi:hypothetical protein